MRMPWALLVLIAPAYAFGLDTSDTRGLAIGVERIPEPLVVDGMTVHVSTARGPDVPALAERLEKRWRSGDSDLQRSQYGDWHVLSRWKGTRSEVLQWRIAGADSELHMSTLDASRRPVLVAGPPAILPAGCKWGRTIEGRVSGGRYSQHSALCQGMRAMVGDRLSAMLAKQGWSMRVVGPHAWDVLRRGATGRVFVAEGGSVNVSAVVWISNVMDSVQ
jgi:hypothetical protein